MFLVFSTNPKVQCPWRWCQPLLGSSAEWKVASDEWHQPSSWDSTCPGRWKIDDTNEDGGWKRKVCLSKGIGVYMCVCAQKNADSYIYNIRIKETSLCNMALVQKNHTISKRKLKKKNMFQLPPPHCSMSVPWCQFHTWTLIWIPVSLPLHTSTPLSNSVSQRPILPTNQTEKNTSIHPIFWGVANFEPLLYLQVAENPPPPRTSFLLRSTVWFAKVVV